MASLIYSKTDKSYRIQFIGQDGRRPTIRLGQVPERVANKINEHVSAIVYAQKHGFQVDKDTVHWINDLTPDLRKKLVKAGLLPDKAKIELGAFTQRYIDERTDLKSGTKEHLTRVRDWLIECFGENRPLAEFTQADAKKFRRWLETDQEQGENTIRRNCGRAKQFFAHALESELITKNPFKVLKDLTVRGNKAKRRFIDRETFRKLLDHCPDRQWQALITMARIGGVRMATEIVDMVWGDIFWDLGKVRIRSAKTERHVNGAERFIPLWPEIRSVLEPMFEEPGKPAKAPTDKVFESSTLPQGVDTNLRTMLKRIVEKAGLIAWPKPFQNMRSTRATELLDSYPAFKVNEWLGHTEAVANEHYRTVTDDDYLEAAGMPLKQTVQNPAHSVTLSSSQENLPAGEDNKKARSWRAMNSTDSQCTNIQATRHGFEP